MRSPDSSYFGLSARDGGLLDSSFGGGSECTWCGLVPSGLRSPPGGASKLPGDLSFPPGGLGGGGSPAAPTRDTVKKERIRIESSFISACLEDTN